MFWCNVSWYETVNSKFRVHLYGVMGIWREDNIFADQFRTHYDYKITKTISNATWSNVHFMCTKESLVATKESLVATNEGNVAAK